jgi:hypothetical protein
VSAPPRALSEKTRHLITITLSVYVYLSDALGVWCLGHRTHDKLWNAAQLQMVQEGKMHGFLRMVRLYRPTCLHILSRLGPRLAVRMRVFEPTDVYCVAVLGEEDPGVDRHPGQRTQVQHLPQRQVRPASVPWVLSFHHYMMYMT